MFFIFNKQKIYTYIVSLTTVILLFCVAAVFNSNNTHQTSQVSANINENNGNNNNSDKIQKDTDIQKK